MAGFANLVVLDPECADPPVLAEFYHQVLGWDVTLSEDEYAEISDGNTRILFSRVDGYEGPGWPDSVAPERYHLCLCADDVANAAERCLELAQPSPNSSLAVTAGRCSPTRPGIRSARPRQGRTPGPGSRYDNGGRPFRSDCSPPHEGLDGTHGQAFPGEGSGLLLPRSSGEHALSRRVQGESV